MSIKHKNRTKEDICLICREKCANATNSHFTPMGLIKSNVGKRNHEETHTIDPNSTCNSETFFGRSNLKNQNPEIKKDPHSEDYIFCQECEDKLGELENKVIPVLNEKLRSTGHAQNFPQTIVTKELFYKTCNNVNPLEIKLFFYSIIWRQCLKDKINGYGTQIIDITDKEELRRIIKSGLYNGCYDNSDIKEAYPITIFTAENFDNPTKHTVNPHLERFYPHVFNINEYVALLYTDGVNLSNRKKKLYNLPSELLTPEMANTSDNRFKISFVSDEEWDNYVVNIIRIAAKRKSTILQSQDFQIVYMKATGKSVIPDFKYRVNGNIPKWLNNKYLKILKNKAQWRPVIGQDFFEYKIMKSVDTVIALLTYHTLEGDKYKLFEARLKK